MSVAAPGLRRTEEGVRRRSWRALPTPMLGIALVLPLVLFAVLFIGYPLIRLVIDSLSNPTGLAAYTELLTKPTTRDAAVNTLVQSFVVTLVCVFFGTSIAWTLVTTKSPVFKAFLWTVTLVPLWMGMVIKNYAILVTMSKNGPINAVLESFGLEPVELLYTPTAVIAGMSYSMMPYTVLLLFAAFSSINQSLMDAAMGLGASRAKAWFDVAVRGAGSGIATTAMVIFVLSIGFYVTPVMLGGLQNPFLATVVSQQILSSFDYPGAAATATSLTLFAVVVVLIFIKIVGKRDLQKILG